MYTPKTYYAGDELYAADMNRIGNGIVAAQSAVESSRAVTQSKATSLFNTKLLRNGTGKMTGSLRIASGKLRLYGGVDVAGNFNGSNLNFVAPNGNLIVNGGAVKTDTNSARPACVLSASNANSGGNNIAFPSVTNIETGSSTAFSLSGGRTLTINSSALVTCMLLVQVVARSSGGSGAHTASVQVTNNGGLPTLNLSAGELVGTNCAIAGAAIVKLSNTAGITLNISATGYVDATVTAWQVDR